MSFAMQGSLLDLDDGLTLHELSDGLTRQVLGAGAWVDLRPGWLTGGDALFDVLHHDVPWRAERRPMYDNVVDVPRLTKFYDVDEPLPHPMLVDRSRGAERPLPGRARRALRHRRAVPLPRRPRQRGLARRPHRPVLTARTRWSPSSRSAVPRPLMLRPRDGGAASRRLAARARRPRRHGWLLPAHLGPRHPQDRQGRGTAHLDPVPRQGCSLIRTASGSRTHPSVATQVGLGHSDPAPPRSTTPPSGRAGATSCERSFATSTAPVDHTHPPWPRPAARHRSRPAAGRRRPASARRRCRRPGCDPSTWSPTSTTSAAVFSPCAFGREARPSAAA